MKIINQKQESVSYSLTSNGILPENFHESYLPNEGDRCRLSRFNFETGMIYRLPLLH